MNLPANIDALISVGTRSRDIIRGAIDHVETTFACETAQEAARQLQEISRSGDVVLIKGSRGLKLEQIVEEYRINFGRTHSE